MSEWTKIENEKPDIGQIVWLNDGIMTWIGGRDWVEHSTWLWGNTYGSIWHNGVKWDGDLEIDDDYQPIYWMPLPDPPNTKTDKFLYKADIR